MKYTFKEIAFNSTEKRIPVEEDRFTYIGLEHLDSRKLSITRYGSDVPLKGEKLVMRKGDILFGKRNTYLKRVAIAPFDGLFSAHGMVLRPNEKVISREFFPFFLSSDYFLDEAIRISVGSLSPTVNWKDLKDLEFEIPDFDRQHKIAEVLSAANNLKESYEAMITATDEMVKSQFIEETKRWSTRSTIGGLVDVNITKAGKKFKAESTIQYIDISSVDNATNTVLGATEYVFKDAPSRAQQCIKAGDILVSTVRPNLKNIAVNHLSDNNLVASSGFCVLRPRDGYTGLLLAYILSDEFTEKMTLVAKGTNYPAVHDSDILDYEITVPEKNEVKRIDSLYRQADKSKFELKQAIEKIDKVMRALMQ